MRNKIILGLLVLISVSFMLLVNGCGTVAGGGGGGGGAAAAAWTYFGNDKTNCIYYYYIAPDSITISGTIELGGYSPYHIAASPDFKKLYVSTDSLKIFVIDTGTNAITSLITLDAPAGASLSKAMCVSSDGKCLYTGVQTSNIYKVYLETGTYESAPLGGFVESIALSPDETKVYFGLDDKTIRKVNASTLGGNTPVATGGASFCQGMAVKDGKLYCPINQAGTNECIIIYTGTDTSESIFGPAGSSTFYSAVAIPGTNEVYISSRLMNGRIYILNTSVPTIETAYISDGDNLAFPDYMAVTADGKYVCVMDLPSTHGRIGYINTTARTVEAYTTIEASTLQVNNIVIVYK